MCVCERERERERERGGGGQTLSTDLIGITINTAKEMTFFLFPAY